MLRCSSDTTSRYGLETDAVRVCGRPADFAFYYREKSAKRVAYACAQHFSWHYAERAVWPRDFFYELVGESSGAPGHEVLV